MHSTFVFYRISDGRLKPQHSLNKIIPKCTYMDPPIIDYKWV